MKESNLAAEFLVIEFIALNICNLIYLIFLNIQANDFLAFIELYKEKMLVSCTLISYLLGIIIHRMGQLVNLNQIRLILRNKKIHLKPITSEDYILIYQNGSQNILERIYYGERLLRVYKASAILFPLLGFECLIYFSNNHLLRTGVLTFVISLFISTFSFISHRLQTRNQVEFINKTASFLKSGNVKGRVVDSDKDK